jgi:hypothetical protein
MASIAPSQRSTRAFNNLTPIDATDGGRWLDRKALYTSGIVTEAQATSQPGC